VLKKYLLETSNIPENQIKIATGEQKELDGIDIFNPGEPTRYIITVEALKEGWDCSFAYVLCSLANVQSDTSVEQLLGRIMRMPYAKTRKSQALNKAYAYVVSPHFGQAAAALVERLKNKGFDDSEALSTVQQEPPKIPDLDPNWNTPPDQYKVTVPLQAADVPPTIQFTNGDTLFFTPATTDDDIQKLCEKIPKTEAHDLVWKFDNYKKSGIAPSPASKGVPFMYTGLPVYRESYRFKKHFLGPANIPAFDSGEETEFAQALDEEPQIQCWLRNAERQAASFRLPTSTDFFYPDFIAQLADNRILAAEYKGAHLADNKDTKEKANVGEVWEKLSNGKALFMIATKTKGGKPLAQQIKEKIGR
jgi:type III restriction enzyme